MGEHGRAPNQAGSLPRDEMFFRILRTATFDVGLSCSGPGKKKKKIRTRKRYDMVAFGSGSSLARSLPVRSTLKALWGSGSTLPNGPTTPLPRWQLGSSESIKLPSAASTSHCIHSSRGQTGCSASPSPKKVERYISMSVCDSARFIYIFQYVDRYTKKEWCQLGLCLAAG